ncbi:MAG: imidazole glycerol phosphate synthase subunit HisH [Chloroflexi bacterium]|nr:imidazole glycerol phosphate synthase subunit HisH [Chloroflexota bacterium]
MIAVIDHGSGNLRNVCKALEHVGAKPVLISDAHELARADKIVLPGVGAFADCLHGLQSRHLEEPLRDIASSGKPLLGICVGMQLLFDTSLEMGEWPGLGLISGRVERFSFDTQAPVSHLKVPHIGWNQVEPAQVHPLLQGVQPGSYAYFVHSYYPVVTDPAYVVATTHYGYDFASVVAKDNVWGIQFHPEKSQDVGLQMLRNFVEGASCS